MIDLQSPFEFPGRYYEIIRADFRNIERETHFLTSFLPAHGRVLDLGCGTGTNLRELSKRGYVCVGVDQSKRFIDYALSLTDNISYSHIPAADFESDQQFDLVTCLFVTLNYMPPADVPILLDKVRRWLKPNGHFILDVAHLLNFVDNYQPYIIAHHVQDDILITRLTRHVMHPHAANWRHEETILVRDSTEVAMYHNSFDQYVYTVKELHSLLSEAGLEVIDEYGAFDRSAKPHDRGHLVMVARPLGG